MNRRFASSNPTVGNPATRPTGGISQHSAQKSAQKTAAITRVRYLEHELFDDDGHVRRGINPVRAEEIVASINELRHALGWLEIDPEGHPLWPR
jgi:hypothetical protein